MNSVVNGTEDFQRFMTQKLVIISFSILFVFACKNQQEKPMNFEVHGIDVSHFQGTVDWPLVKDQGVSFAFVKATEGLFHCDTLFYKNWKSIKQANLLRGAYHFFIPDVDAAQQAQNFLINVTLQNGDLPPVLDMEITDHTDPDAVVESIREWLDIVSTAFNTKPIIYTNLKSYFRFIAGRFDEYPVWIARYKDKIPDLGNSKEWSFWQYNEKGKLNGIEDEVDLNAFNGSFQELQEMCLKNIPSSELLQLVGSK